MGQYLASAILLLAALLFFTARVIPAIQSTVGQASYYTAARLLGQGQLNTNLYDDVWFGDQIEKDAGAGVRDVFTSSPPSAALLMLPLARLPYAQASLIWGLFNVTCFAVALGLLMRESATRLPPIFIVALAALMLLARPVMANFGGQQLYALLLLIYVFAWRAVCRGHLRTAGILLGLTIGFKASGWMIVLLWLIQRRWRLVGWSALTGAVIFSFSLLLIGLDVWREYLFVQVPRVMSWPAAPLTAYQTTTGFLQHVLRFDAVWNPGPLVDAPALATLFYLAVILWALWMTSRVRESTMLFVLGLTLSELLSPFAEDYHFILFVLPLFVMWREVVRGRNWMAWLIACSSTALIILAIPFEQPAWSHGWLSLLAYPRLYGGWLMWGLLVTYALKKPAHEINPS
jgi:hypothetical protein